MIGLHDFQALNQSSVGPILLILAIIFVVVVRTLTCSLVTILQVFSYLMNTYNLIS